MARIAPTAAGKRARMVSPTFTLVWRASSNGFLAGCGCSGASAAGSQILREIIGKVALKNSVDSSLEIVLDSGFLHSDGPGNNIQDNVSCSPVAILGAADASRVHKVDALGFAVPGNMSVAEGDHVSR